jgi:hypothetical protein
MLLRLPNLQYLDALRRQLTHVTCRDLESLCTVSETQTRYPLVSILIPKQFAYLQAHVPRRGCRYWLPT